MEKNKSFFDLFYMVLNEGCLLHIYNMIYQNHHTFTSGWISDEISVKSYPAQDNFIVFSLIIIEFNIKIDR